MKAKETKYNNRKKPHEKAVEYAKEREESILMQLGEDHPAFPGVMLAVRHAFLDGANWQEGKSIALHEKDILSLDEAALYLDLSRSTLYKLTSGNKISFYKPDGKMIYFKREDLVNWVTRKQVNS